MASDLFAHLKKLGVKVEYVPEYAKELVYEKSPLVRDQLHVFAEQNRRLYQKLGEVDFIVTDSPILLSAIYVDENNTAFPAAKLNSWRSDFKTMVFETHRMYNNVNFLIKRSERAFVPDGRIHDLQASIAIDEKIKDQLRYMPYYSIEVYQQALEFLGL